MSDTFTRKQIYDLVWKQPMSTVAREFGISDRGLAKLCDRHGIPVPPRGFWAKAAAGKLVKRPPLIEFESRKPEPSIFVSRQAAPATAGSDDDNDPPLALPEEIQVAIDQEQRPEHLIKVPEALHNPHKIVAKWVEQERRELEATKADPWRSPYRLKSIKSSPLEKRRLRILDALMKALERRGFSVHAEQLQQTSPIIVSHDFTRVSITIDERIRRDRRLVTDEDRKTGQFSDAQKWTQRPSPTGELQLALDRRPYSSDADYCDRAGQPLEVQMNDIMGGIIKAIWQAKKERLERNEAERIKHENEERRKHQEKLERAERSKKRALLNMAERLRRAADIRVYTSEVERAVAEGTLKVYAEEFARWRDWARACADEIDPIVSGDSFSVTAHTEEEEEPSPEHYHSDRSVLPPRKPFFPGRPWYSR